MNRLKQLRLDEGLSPEELGEKAEVSGMTVRRAEAGKVVSDGSLIKLAEALDAKASELQRPAIFGEVA